MRVSRDNKKVLWGLFFILIAAYMIISRIWILPKISVFTIVVTVFLGGVLIKGLRRVNFWQILFPIAFLCILYDEPLGITNLTPWTVLGAALFGSIGLSMIFKTHVKPRLEFEYDSDKSPSFELEYDSNAYSGGTGSRQDTGETVHFENNFGESIKYICSDNFVRGHFENNFGSMSVYFDNAVIREGMATAEVESNFGEMKLYIPREWKVMNDLEHNIGSVEEIGRCEGTADCKLLLTGEANFGNIVVHYI